MPRFPHLPCRPSIVPLASRSAFAVLLAAFTLIRPAIAAPLDVPVVVANDNVESWTVGAGLVYWAHNCFADEFNSFAGLKRKPTSGGPQRTIEDIDDGARCNTFHNLLSADDGLYYFDASLQRIARLPLGEPFIEQLVVPLTASQAPYAGKDLVAAGGYLYWVSSSNAILRTLMDASGAIETVADTGAAPTELIVVGNYVYWAEASGIWTIGIACGALPCTGDRQQYAPFGANTAGYGLLYQYIGGVRGSHRVYWVERVASGANSDYRIRYRSCDNITNCTIVDPSTFYQGTTNWRVGQLAVAAGNVYWTELDHTTVNNPNGDVKRRAWNAAAPGADTIATAQARISDRVYVAGDNLYFARRGVGVYTLPLGASPILRDFKLDGMEVTQGIQDLGNGVPLVAKKATYVRAYGLQLSGPSAPNVEARLVGTRSGLALPGSPLAPVNAVRALATGGGYDRARLGDGWYFLLPAAWLTPGTTDLTVELDARQNHNDPDRSNNARSVAAVFRDVPPVCVMSVPVRTHTPLPSTTDPNFWTMVDHFHRRWPIPDVWVYRATSPVEELEVCWWGPVPHPCFGPYELDDGWGITNGIPDRDKVIVSLWTRALLSFNPDACDAIGAPVHFMGMVHPNAENGGSSGYASTVSNQSWVQLPAHGPLGTAWDALREGSTMAQELAHNDGRKHVDCGGPEDVDTNYPYPPCQIGNVGPTSHYGFDTRNRQPIRPDQTADFMSYSDRSWVSDYTWRALVGQITGGFVATADTATSLRSQVAGMLAQGDQSVFVSGLVDTANIRGAITSLLVLPTGSVPPATRQRLSALAARAGTAPQQAPTFRLRLVDAVGTVLVERALTPQPMDDHEDGSDSAMFSDLFPPPSAPVAAVQLWAGTELLDSRAPGAAMPQATVLSPASGAQIENSLTITWSASDADVDDRLLSTVQYSPDGGGRWHTLATDVPFRDLPPGPGMAMTRTLQLDDLGTLHGSAPGAGLIRVLVSDGYNTAIATSQPFTVLDRAPTVVVSAPQPDQTLAAGEDVLLMGNGLDAEDGGLADEALAWQVDGRPAGTGRSVNVPGLAPGAHGALLAGSDTNGHVATTTVSFAIAPLGVHHGVAPLLDGSCDDAVYAAGASLELAPYADGSRGGVRVLRSNDHLWACFRGLPRGVPSAGSSVELLVDADNSRSPLAQPADFRFVVAEDGSVFGQAGDGAGGFASPGPAGLIARMGGSPTAWSVEMRIDKARFGGWDHLAGLAFGHASVATADDFHAWPFAAERGQPATWAASSLGDQPILVALGPASAAVGDAPFTVGITGTGFVSGTLAVWNGVPLATTFIDDEHLTAEVTSAQLAAAGRAQVMVRAPAPGLQESNELQFLVNAPLPMITGVAPTSVAAGSGVLSLSVHGTGFASDAQVLWNGAPLATQVVSATLVTAQVPAALTANGQSVGIAVRNQLPFNRVSGIVRFEIVPPTAGPVPSGTPAPTGTPPTETPPPDATPVASDTPSPTAIASATANVSPTGTPPLGHPALYIPRASAP